jgi:hypothetical protein
VIIIARREDYYRVKDAAAGVSYWFTELGFNVLGSHSFFSRIRSVGSKTRCLPAAKEAPLLKTISVEAR